MDMQVRRVEMADDSHRREDFLWILFESGHIMHPLAVLTDHEAKYLAVEITRQSKEKR